MTGMEDPPVRKFRRRAPIVVKLTCGCPVHARCSPWPQQVFGCDSGVGHGYRLRWTEYTDEHGQTWQNRTL